MAYTLPIAFDYLRRAHAGQRLGHAYLLAGAEPAAALAMQIAALVVHAPTESVLTHPDVHMIEPESKSRRIVVEQIRTLESALRLRAATAGGRKVGIIREAERPQPQAANAFLKTLEEPPAGSLLLLVSAQPESLLDTIVSRCLRVSLQAPADDYSGVYHVEEVALRDHLARYANGHAYTASAPSPVAAAYRLLREFSRLLVSVRARLQADADEALEREDDQYSKTTDGSWLAERETYYKSLVEARYAAERSRLVEVLGRWWGDALRKKMTGPTGADHADALAKILRRLAAVDELRENLDRNIQEALALEVAFIQIFGG